MQVPVLSIIFMFVTGIVSVGLPVLLFVYVYKKFNGKFIPMLVGAAAFIVFALILERSIHLYVFAHFPLREMPALYIIYGIFMAGIFEESARFISFNFLKKKYEGIGTGLSYGIGHGGSEAILLAGLGMVNAIVIAFLVNTGATETITGNLQGELLEQTITAINTIVTTKPVLFLVSGIERIIAVTVHISLSVFVFYSVYKKGKIWLYPCAIALHAIADIPAAAMQVNVLKSIFLVEALTGVAAACLVFLAYTVHKKFNEEKAAIETE